jgi:hypothetical protein
MAELIRSCQALGRIDGRRRAAQTARGVGEAVGGMLLGVLLLPVVWYAILRGS